MAAAAPVFRKFGKITGTLTELGRFVQRGAEVQYAFVKLETGNDEVTSLERVRIPGELNKLLKIGDPVMLFIARRGVWNFCYGVDNGDAAAQSYRGYRLYFLFNRLIMYVNLMFGAYLVMTPGAHWAGGGLLLFGVLFAFLGPASPRRLNAFFAANRPPGGSEEARTNQSSDG